MSPVPGHDALFFEPYNDTPQNSGLAGADMLSQGNMLKMIREADRAGLFRAAM